MAGADSQAGTEVLRGQLGLRCYSLKYHPSVAIRTQSSTLLLLHMLLDGGYIHQRIWGWMVLTGLQ